MSLINQLPFICKVIFARSLIRVTARFVSQTGSLQVLSQQMLVDCSWGFGNNGCDGGEEWRGYEWILKHGGIATTETYGAYMGMVSPATTRSNISIQKAVYDIFYADCCGPVLTLFLPRRPERLLSRERVAAHRAAPELHQRDLGGRRGPEAGAL